MEHGLEENMIGWANEYYEKLLVKMKAQSTRLGTAMPYIPENGQYYDMGERHLEAWTNGFYAGILWQLYHATADEDYRRNAEGIEKRFDAALEKYVNLDHDVGFQWLHTAVADYRITGNPKSRQRGLHAANLLAGRFHVAGQYIRAWNSEERAGLAIVDSLMNLPLLYWAAQETNDVSYRQTAMAHTDMALTYIVRSDGSCNHMIRFHPITGEYLENPGGQGYESGSSWARGQAWALYGMVLAYRYTKEKKYLEAAKRIAHYFAANVALTDYISLIDFRAPKDPAYLDTTAGVCAACGMLEIAEHVGIYEKFLYIKTASLCLQAACEKYCNWSPEEDSILGCGSVRYASAEGREVPLIYGDYFLVEGLLRLLGKNFMIW